VTFCPEVTSHPAAELLRTEEVSVLRGQLLRAQEEIEQLRDKLRVRECTCRQVQTSDS
jgi:hypothetical protein